MDAKGMVFLLFNVLGTFEVQDADGGRIKAGGGKQLTALGVLLLFANRWVSSHRLIDFLWETDPPRSAAGNLSTYLWGLGLVLPPTRAGAARIGRGSGRYRLSVERAELDSFTFEDLVAAGRQAEDAGDREEAAARFEEALGLWRGVPFEGLGSPMLHEAAAPLLESRWQVEEELIDLRLELGQHAAVIGRVQEAVTAQPTREHRWEQLMLALDGCGRRAEALDAFQRVYRFLGEELGVEPGPRLKELQAQILSATRPTADRPKPSAMPGVLVPAQLPAAVPDFTGRRDALKYLDNLVSLESGVSAVVISAITGTAGVGKTALAVHWAHSVADRFADGQLYLNLQGYSTGRPIEPGQALEWMLHALGVPGDQVPPDLESKTGMYRSALAGRRLLIVLDNVSAVSQVRPLLPGSPGCLALITSRDSLTGLVALNGARRVDLGVLTDEESLDLLARLLGPERVEAESAAVARLIELCARLPLALRLAAAGIGATIADSVDRLAEDQLGLLAVDGDPEAVVRRQFDHSYLRLTGPQQRMFRLLGLIPMPEVGPYAAAALADVSVVEATRLLRQLVAAHLVEEPVTDRYTFHDLLRAYAVQLVQQEDSAADRDAASDRLADWYLTAAGAAMNQIDPRRVQLPNPPAPPPIGVPVFETHQQAMEWLEAERPALLALTADAGRRGRNDRVWQFPQTLWRFFYIRGYQQDWISTHEAALKACEQMGGEWALGETLHNLAGAWRRSGDTAVAIAYGERALVMRRRCGDLAGEAATLGTLGTIRMMLGENLLARDDLEQCLAILRVTAGPPHRAMALINLGLLDHATGRNAEALDRLGEALELFRQSGNRIGEAHALGALGKTYEALSDYPAALEHQQAALELHRELGERWSEANAISNLGSVLCRLGRYDESLQHQKEALAISNELGDSELESSIRNSLGEHHLAVADHDAAATEYELALRHALRTGNRRTQAAAHHGLARANHTLDRHDVAHRQWHQALALYADQHLPEADALRTEIATLDETCAVP
ncbi:BTAD domain-containing putative transcriptional regulator [Kribbella sp. NPDC056951]|uniref:AfsR/SARP family transcriptional regulator n=1 Tax=Kribbella sp. NPDC056951 TaxID=3345978 RepID=UPI003645D755